MISRLAIPPGEVSAAALLLVVGPGLRGLEIEAAINLIVGPGLTGVCVTKEVEAAADAFLDFLGALVEFEVLGFSFLFLHNSKVINNYTQKELILY